MFNRFIELKVFLRYLIFVSGLASIGVVQGCVKVSYYTHIDCVAPNWTSDNKIVFFKVERIWKRTKTFYSERVDLVSQKSYLCEINADGTGFREIGLVFDDVHQWLNASSSAGEWVVFDNVTEIDNVTNSFADGEIWVIKRDGTGLKKIGKGLNPDFSPDASKIVYEKPDSGIWIMNRDGTGDHCIVRDPNAKCPAWSPEGRRIAYIKISSSSLGKDSLCIVDTLSNLLLAFYLRVEDIDWGPLDSNAISFKNGYFYNNDESWHHIAILHLEHMKIDTLKEFRIGDNPYWSPTGEQFIAYDASGYFIIDYKGTNKWYLKEKIQGGE